MGQLTDHAFCHVRTLTCLCIEWTKSIRFASSHIRSMTVSTLILDRVDLDSNASVAGVCNLQVIGSTLTDTALANISQAGKLTNVHLERIESLSATGFHALAGVTNLHISACSNFSDVSLHGLHSVHTFNLTVDATPGPGHVMFNGTGLTRLNSLRRLTWDALGRSGKYFDPAVLRCLPPLEYLELGICGNEMLSQVPRVNVEKIYLHLDSNVSMTADALYALKRTGVRELSIGCSNPFQLDARCKDWLSTLRSWYTHHELENRSVSVFVIDTRTFARDHTLPVRWSALTSEYFRFRFTDSLTWRSSY
jgi:hypothetical protein